MKFALSLETEYRFSFLLEIFVEIAYFAVTILSIRIIYWNIPEIAGWGYYELLVLLGVNMLFFETLLGVSFIFNLRKLPSVISEGGLDLVLMKPLNSQFAVSLWRPYFAMLPSILAGMVTVYVGFTRGGLVFDIVRLPVFLFMLICGLVMGYSVGMVISTLSMWFINATPLPSLAESTLFMAKNPHSVFSGAWKIIFMTVLPIAFMVSFPSSVLLGDLQIWWLPASFVLAVVFLKSSNLFWNFALKKYSSASS